MSTQEQLAPSRSEGAHGGTGVVHGDPVQTHAPAHTDSIHLPRPTAYPIIAALGFTLLVAGILTHYVISILGVCLLAYGCVGWFREVLPHEMHENITVRVQEISIASARKSVGRLPGGAESGGQRAHVGVGAFSPLVGLKGGVAGGIAMIFPALAYGLIAQHSIWYPVNLLGGAGVSGMTGFGNPTMQDLRAFHMATLGFATIIHVISCTLIGLLYGSILPLMPKHPIILGGIIAPLAWTGILFAALPTINPEMSAHISWPDFLLAQFVFGITAGWVVSRSSYYRTAKSLPFAMRLGFEGGGVGREDGEDHR